MAIIAVVCVVCKLNSSEKRLKTEENKKASNFTKRLLFIIVLNYLALGTVKLVLSFGLITGVLERPKEPQELHLNA